MKQTTSTETSAEAEDLKNQDQHGGGVEVVERSDGSADEPVEAIDPTYAFWQLRDLRACADIVLGFQAIYLAADWSQPESRHEAVLLLHLFNILNAVVFLGLTHLRSYRNRIPQLILGGCMLLFAATAALSLLTLNREPLTITVTIMMVGVAALVPWGWRWQAALSFTGAGSIAASMLLWPAADPHLGYDWLAIVAAAGVAHYATLSGQRYRREIESRIMAFQVNHRQLLAEVAAREVAIQRLGQSEAKLRKIFEVSPDAIAITRMADGMLLDVNESMCVASGLQRKDLIGHKSGEIGAWPDGELKRFWDLMGRDGRVQNMDLSVQQRGGRIIPQLVSSVVAELGGEMCAVSMAHDITEQKKAETELVAAREVMRGQIESLQRTEEQLRAEILERTSTKKQREEAVRKLGESEEKLGKIFDTSPDAISIHRLSDGRYLDVNDGFRATGYSREEALRQTAGSLGIWADPRQLREFLHVLKKDGRITNLDFDVRCKSGAVRPYLVSATVIELGGEPCVVAICRDITTIKQTEEQLRAEILERTRAMTQREEALRKLADSEGKMRRLFEVSPDSISIARMADGKLIAVNQSLCAMTGLTPEELIGRRSIETEIWDDPTVFKKFALKLRDEGRVRALDAVLRHRSGRLIPHSVSAVVTELGGELCAISTAHDITERKHLEIELRAARSAALAASQAKSEFLSSMSHEIRTPMNAILGMAELLEETPLNSDQKKYLKIMTNSGDALLELINGILDLARIERAGNGRLSRPDSILKESSTAPSKHWLFARTRRVSKSWPM